MGGPDVKVATVDVESGDNTTTLPVSRSQTGSSPVDTAEKNNAANKEMELKNVVPKPLERFESIIYNFDFPDAQDIISHNLILVAICSKVTIL